MKSHEIPNSSLISDLVACNCCLVSKTKAYDCCLVVKKITNCQEKNKTFDRFI